MTKPKLASLALAAALSLGASLASADTTLINEGFDNVGGLTANGWLLLNRSSPLGGVDTWYQGQDYIFPAMSGASNSYAASNYNAGTTGGSIADWLMTPTFSTRNSGQVSFWIRSEVLPDYTDYFSYGLSSGGTGTADFMLTRAAIVPGQWSQYTLNFTGTGADTTGRLAIVHVGLADIANYIGVDNVVVTAVPELPTPALAAAGLLTLALLRRRLSSR